MVEIFRPLISLYILSEWIAYTFMSAMLVYKYLMLYKLVYRTHTAIHNHWVPEQLHYLVSGVCAPGLFTILLKLGTNGFHSTYCEWPHVRIGNKYFYSTHWSGCTCVLLSKKNVGNVSQKVSSDRFIGFWRKDRRRYKTPSSFWEMSHTYVSV